MGSQDQTERRPDLFAAIAKHNDNQRQARDEAGREERQEREQLLTADAALYGTAGWKSLSPARQQMAAAWSAEQSRGGGSDAA